MKFIYGIRFCATVGVYKLPIKNIVNKPPKNEKNEINI